MWTFTVLCSFVLLHWVSSWYSVPLVRSSQSTKFVTSRVNKYTEVQEVTVLCFTLCTHFALTLHFVHFLHFALNTLPSLCTLHTSWFLWSTILKIALLATVVNTFWHHTFIWTQIFTSTVFPFLIALLHPIEALILSTAPLVTWVDGYW